MTNELPRIATQAKIEPQVEQKLALPSVPTVAELASQLESLVEMDDVTIEVEAHQSGDGQRDVTMRVRAYRLGRK